MGDVVLLLRNGTGQRHFVLAFRINIANIDSVQISNVCLLSLLVICGHGYCTRSRINKIDEIAGK